MNRLLFPIKKCTSLLNKSIVKKQKSLQFRINKLEKTQICQDDIKLIMKKLFEQQSIINEIQVKLDNIDETNKALTDTLDYFVETKH